MDDKVFGKLEYDYGWNGTASLNFINKEVQVDLVIQEEEDVEFTELQYDSYRKFMEGWDQIQREVMKSILEYYRELREELGYEDGSNEDYPEVNTIVELQELLSLDSIVIPPSDIYDERCIGLAFSCDWDEENGVGVRLLDEEIDEIGYQDIIF